MNTKARRDEAWRLVIEDGKGGVRLREDRLLDPLRWRARRSVTVADDLFHPKVPRAFLHRAYAAMASCSQHLFTIPTKHPERARAYYAGLVKAGPAAQARYIAGMRRHFKSCKREFMEGYTLPEPPTPELRYLYDRARRYGRKFLDSRGKPYYHHYEGGEFHWREWPLFNVTVVAANQERRGPWKLT